MTAKKIEMKEAEIKALEEKLAKEEDKLQQEIAVKRIYKGYDEPFEQKYGEEYEKKFKQEEEQKRAKEEQELERKAEYEKEQKKQQDAYEQYVKEREAAEKKTVEEREKQAKIAQPGLQTAPFEKIPEMQT